MSIYNTSEAYDFSYFEPEKYTEPKQKKNNNVSTKNRNVSKVLPLMVIKTLAIASCAVVCFVMLLSMNADANALNRQIAAKESEIDILDTESVRLKSKYSGLFSPSKIDYYAEEVLGMVKVDNSQIAYIDISEGDKIVVSGDKTLDCNSKFSKMIEKLSVYIKF